MAHPVAPASPDAGPPAMSRRHAAGADSARSLLFTILGEFVLPGGQVAWTSAFIETMGRLSVEEKACRQALMRTAADGWLGPERVGRRTRWRLSPSAQRLLTEGTERIYGFTGASADWDGRWLLVMARVPEADRRARHLLRTRLAWAGLGSPTAGVWISTHTERAAEVEQVLADAGVADGARIFVAEHRSGDLAAMVGQAWDLGAIEHSYRQFLATFTPPSPADALTRLVELVHAWRRFPWTDPTLPRELLPDPWSGFEAATIFAHQHARLAPDAIARWADLNRLPE